MSWDQNAWLIALCSVLLLSSAATVTLKWPSPWTEEQIYEKHDQLTEKLRQNAILRAGPRLRPVDRVEVLRLGKASTDVDDGYRLRPYDFKITAPILARQVLLQDEAREVADLWRQCSFDTGGGALCHDPPYALRFYAGNHLVSEASICWMCSNFEVWINFQEYSFGGFADPEDRLWRHLQTILPVSPMPK